MKKHKMCINVEYEYENEYGSTKKAGRHFRAYA